MHAETSFFFYPRYILTATIYKLYQVLFMAWNGVLTCYPSPLHQNKNTPPQKGKPLVLELFNT